MNVTESHMLLSSFLSAIQSDDAKAVEAALDDLTFRVPIVEVYRTVGACFHSTHAPIEVVRVLARRGILPMELVLRVIITSSFYFGNIAEIAHEIFEHIHPSAIMDILCTPCCPRHIVDFFIMNMAAPGDVNNFIKASQDRDACINSLVDAGHVPGTVRRKLIEPDSDVDALVPPLPPPTLVTRISQPRTQLLVFAGAHSTNPVVTYGTDGNGWMMPGHQLCAMPWASRIAPWTSLPPAFRKLRQSATFRLRHDDPQNYDLPVFALHTETNQYCQSWTYAMDRIPHPRLKVITMHVNGIRTRQFMVRKTCTHIRIEVRKGSLSYITRFDWCAAEKMWVMVT